MFQLAGKVLTEAEKLSLAKDYEGVCHLFLRAEQGSGVHSCPGLRRVPEPVF